jgi:hypothetical protein
VIPIDEVVVRMRFQPEGAVAVTELGRTTIEAIITVPSTVPEGLATVRVLEAALACAAAIKVMFEDPKDAAVDRTLPATVA